MTQPTRQDASPLLGTWELVGMWSNGENGVRNPPSAGWEDAKGYVTYTADGRMFALLSKRNKTPVDYPDTDDTKRIEAHKSMVAYTGLYDFYGDHVLHHVDICWIPDWEGADQRREVSLDGEAEPLELVVVRLGPSPDGFDPYLNDLLGRVIEALP